MEITEPPSYFINLLIVRPDGNVILFMFIVLILLLLSALISSAESAFFSLSPQETDKLKQENSSNSNLILDLLNQPKELLATILITNNFLNVGIVILCSFIINYFFPFADNYFRFFLEVIGITLLILLWGEVDFLNSIIFLFPFLIIFLLFQLFLSWYGSIIFSKSPRVRVAKFFCISQKSLAMGLPLAGLLFAGETELEIRIICPLILYHFLQLVVGAFFISPLKSWVRRTC